MPDNLSSIMALFLWRIISIAFLLCVAPISSQTLTKNSSFVYNGFNQADSETLSNSGASIIKDTRLLRLTNKTRSVIGHSFYKTPFSFFNKSSSSSSVFSFSTHFVFSIVSPRSGEGGYGLAFVVAPKTDFPEAQAEHLLGLFNNENNGQKTNRILAVEFDTVNGLNQKSDSSGNHVGININGMESNSFKPAGYHYGSTSNIEDLRIESQTIQVWVDYDGAEAIINVTLAPISAQRKPARLLYLNYNLADVFIDEMYVGFSSSTGANKASAHYILGWSFSIGGEPTPGLNLSLLPSPPPQERDTSSSLRYETKILVACLSAIIVTLFLVLLFTVLYKRMASYERLEEWERDCPHRFGYRDLFLATKGFKDSEIIGVGGFGAVYKGVLPSTGCTVAVKKITRSSDLGMREFAAEIESLGRLRHKNLVNLQGWCKNKSNLLIVYDYIPFGSLDTLIFKPKSGLVLGWESRLNILRGVASGLLYLHEEWEQVVIHRDVKSNNVLIDDHMCARLGDFGLARLHDHGEIASRTTGVVGTIGYIAPELARFGKASTATDVYAFGALLLEVATGSRPISGDDFVLADWVMELHQAGRVLEAADPALGGSYSRDEMELVLILGLLCSHFKPEPRPTMRQVIRYLDREDQVPAEIDQWGLFDSRRVNHLGARIMQGISSDKITSYRSSSVGALSYSSLDAGR